MPPEQAEVRRWLEKAQHDLIMAEAGMAQSPPITDGAAFHCQQAVEKLLKAYLVHQGHEFEKLHDLRVLSQACQTHDSGFESIIPQVIPLTAYAVRFRYPGYGDPTAEEVEEAQRVVQKVWDFVLARLPEAVHP